MPKMMTLTILLVIALVMGYPAGTSMANGASTNGERSGIDPTGMTVKNLGGETLGTVAEIVEGPEGYIAFAILRYIVSDDSQILIPVPFPALKCEGTSCLLNAGREALSAAPISSVEELTKPRVAEEIYRYFGLQPYWTEEEV